jgi:hypothetical protein
MLLQTLSDTNLANETAFKDVHVRLAKLVGHGRDFLFVHPDIASIASTAVAALRTFKSQTVTIPGSIGHALTSFVRKLGIRF